MPVALLALRLMIWLSLIQFGFAVVGQVRSEDLTFGFLALYLVYALAPIAVLVVARELLKLRITGVAIGVAVICLVDYVHAISGPIDLYHAADLIMAVLSCTTLAGIVKWFVSGRPGREIIAQIAV